MFSHFEGGGGVRWMFMLVMVWNDDDMSREDKVIVNMMGIIMVMLGVTLWCTTVGNGC